jgi:polar amino acid transport system substrate-binding protein
MIDAHVGATVEPSGIDVDIVRELARRTHMDVTIIRCPWLRCLKLMETGEADLLSSAYKKPEREQYMQYFDHAYLDRLPIAFYVRKDSDIQINAYEDLYRLDRPVGVLRGASYFPRFDGDTLLKKAEISTQDQLFPMLVGRRLDVIAGYVPTANFRLITEGYQSRVRKSQFEYSERADVYMAVSKKSPLLKRFKELNDINTILLAQGVLQRIRESYYEKYSPK